MLEVVEIKETATGSIVCLTGYVTLLVAEVTNTCDASGKNQVKTMS